MSDRDPRRPNSNRPDYRDPASYVVSPQQDLSWLDFLRTAGGTVPADPPGPASRSMDRSTSADRKRRLTGPDSAAELRRSYPFIPITERYPPANEGGTASLPGVDNTRATAIDSTSPPRRPPPAAPRPAFRQVMQTSSEELVSTPAARGEGDITLPPWQPDAKVAKCPVCQAEFSFWFRKHHCRKCGRVVCANCSPHRITIPKQYIIQPPNPYEDEANSGSPGGSRVNPALGGGETVRVCNPCVPDPWTPHTSASNPDPDGPGRSATRPPPRFAPTPSDPRPQVSREALAREVFLRQAIEPDRPERYRSISSSHGSVRSRAHTHQTSAGFSRPIPHVNEGAPLVYGNFRQDGPHPNLTQRYGHRHSQSNVDRVAAPLPGFSPVYRLSDPRASVAAPQAPSRRREIKEEDECPVCGVELPPGEALREVHVRQCIESRFSSTPTQPPRSAPPAQEARALPPSVSSATPPVVPEGSRPRATSYRPRGMALYRATEKDCTTEDGEPQECVICFEEFETGDEMGRMECLCKFHRHCIRQWWDAKGQGSCPTHQLHE